MQYLFKPFGCLEKSSARFFHTIDYAGRVYTARPVKGEKMAAKNKEDNGEKKSGGLLKILFIVLGGLLAGAIVFFLILYFVGIPGVVPKLAKAKPPVYENIELGERVINLLDDNGGRYLRIKVVVEIQKNEKLSKEIEEKKPQIIEGIINVFRQKKVEDVLPLSKDKELKEEVLKVINARLKLGKVEHVYFTDFIVQ